MNQMISHTTGFSPTYRIHIYHPDSRDLLAVPLKALTDRIERALAVDLDPRWLPLLVAMADGLFMQADAIRHHIDVINRLVSMERDRSPHALQDLLETLTGHRILERHNVEQLYRCGRLDELNHPRVWELNAWWEKLYGIVPARSEWDEEEELDIWEEGTLGLDVGKTALPLGVSPERDDVRMLLEAKVLSQYEHLYRLRLSWHK